MKELITLSRCEVQRMQVLDQVRKGALTLKAVAGARSENLAASRLI